MSTDSRKAPHMDLESGKKSYTLKTKNGHSWKVTRLSKEDIKEKLAEMEEKYGMTTREFARKYHSSGFDEENLEFIDWIWFYETDLGARAFHNV